MLLLTVAILSVATMMVAPVSVGYASSYTATTQSTGNEITTEYYTVGLYTYTLEPDIYPDSVAYSPSNFTPATSYISPGVSFRYGEGKISGTNVSMSPADLYFVIFASNVSSTSTFNLGGLEIVMKAGGIALDPSHISYTFTLGGSANPTMSANIAYKVNTTVTLAETTVTSNQLTCSMTLTSLIVNHMNGSFTFTDCNVNVVEYSEEVQDIIDTNNEDLENTPYNVQPSTNTDQYDGSPAISIAGNNSGGIVPSGNGSINVTISVPAGTKFAIAIYNKNGYTKDQTLKLQISGTKNGKSVSYPKNPLDVTISRTTGTNTLYFYLDNSGSNILANETSLPTDSHGQWFELEGDVTIHVERKQGAGGTKLDPSTMFDVVLKSVPSS